MCVSCHVPVTEDNSLYQEFTSLGELQSGFLETGVGYSENGSVAQGIKNTAFCAESEDSQQEESPWSFR